jgi:hypothetical protein
MLGPIRIGGQEAFLALNMCAGTIDAELLCLDSSVYLASSPQREVVDVLHLGPYEVALLYTV